MMEGGSQHPNGSNGGTGLTLPSVLHFLNTEWRRFERERSEWVLERDALKASLAQLNGAKLALETKNVDLLRRVKMLQFALQSERLRTNATAVSAPAAAPASVMDSAVDPPPPPPPLPFSKGPLHTRSKEVLKAFLREADFLLSLSAAKPSSFLDSHLASSTAHSRTTKGPIPSAASGFGAHIEDDAFPDSLPLSTTARTTNFDRDSGEHISLYSSSSSSSSSNEPITKVSILKNPSTHASSNSNSLQTSHVNGPGRKERTSSIKDLQEGAGGMTGDMSANAATSTTSTRRVTVKSVEFVEVTDLDTVDSLPLHHGNDVDIEDIDTNSGVSNTPDHSLVLNGDEDVILLPDTTDLSEDDAPLWKPKASLNSHLDAVRALAFFPHTPHLLSCSEDGTAKLWALPTTQSPSESRRARATALEPEPLATLRAHAGPVTSLALDRAGERAYTGGLDSTIRVWDILACVGRETYDAMGTYPLKQTVVSHTDAVWCLALSDTVAAASGATTLLASASADGTVKLFDVAEGVCKLRSALRREEGAGDWAPTGLGWVPQAGGRRLAVGYQDSGARVWDVETGVAVMDCRSGESFDGTLGTQINAILVHPTLPLLISAHEDRWIRFFDIATGTCIHSMRGHLDAVTSLALSPSTTTFASTGHDCSMRWWDVAQRRCVQEYTTHRAKGAEGIWTCAFQSGADAGASSEEGGLFASAGADGVVKLFGRG